MNNLKNQVSFIQLLTPTTYSFLNLQSFHLNQLIQYPSDEAPLIYREYHQFSNLQIEKSRSIQSVWTTFGKVGGMIRFIKLILALFLVPYSKMCYQMKSISQLFLEHKEKVSKTIDKQIRISFSIQDKLASYFGAFCFRKKQAKILKYGVKVLDQDMSIINQMLNIRQIRGFL